MCKLGSKLTEAVISSQAEAWLPQWAAFAEDTVIHAVLLGRENSELAKEERELFVA